MQRGHPQVDDENKVAKEETPRAKQDPKKAGHRESQEMGTPQSWRIARQTASGRRAFSQRIQRLGGVPKKQLGTINITKTTSITINNINNAKQ